MSMDDVAKFNKERWEELAQADVAFSRPYLNLDPCSARQLLDPHDMMGNLNGKDVLCLASGGGQQSVAFGILGATVTVFDLSETQLDKDRTAAAHYGLPISLAQGDMRDLSRFDAATFDVVWQAHSINFVPSAVQVFQEVARVIRSGGLYRMEFANPFVAGIDERDWNGEAYPLRLPYRDGAEIEFADPDWEISYDDGTSKRVEGPKEYRHTLRTIINGLSQSGFVILGAWEEVGDDPTADPGSWEHFKSIAPPWITIWAAFLPHILIAFGPQQSDGTTSASQPAR